LLIQKEYGNIGDYSCCYPVFLIIHLLLNRRVVTFNLPDRLNRNKFIFPFAVSKVIIQKTLYMKQFILSGVFCIIASVACRAQINSFQHFTAATSPVLANSANAFKTVEKNRWFIWAGTQYKGLYLYDTMRKIWHQAPQLTNVFINDIKVDRANGIWIAQSGILGSVGGGSSIAGGGQLFPAGKRYGHGILQCAGYHHRGRLVIQECKVNIC